MADWDDDSPRLIDNVAAVLRGIRDTAAARELPRVELARRWHQDLMAGLTPPHPKYVGAFRGEPGLEQCEVQVGRHWAVPASDVLTALERFESTLQAVVARLDAALPRDAEPGIDQTGAVLDAMAWVHAEWIRIHPFANGNGRTARLWANFIALRYGLPPFVRLRPRPDGAYGTAGAHAMTGNWQPTAALFAAMLARFLDPEGHGRP